MGVHWLGVHYPLNYLMNMKIWWIWIFQMPGRPVYVGVLAYVRKQFKDTPWVYGPSYRQMVPMPDRIFDFPVMRLERAPLQHCWKQRLGSRVFLPLMSSQYPTKDPTWFNNISTLIQGTVGLFYFIESFQGHVIPFSVSWESQLIHCSRFPHFNLLTAQGGR